MSKVKKWYEAIEAIEPLREELRQAEERGDEEEAARLEAKLSSVITSIPKIISREELTQYHNFLKDKIMGDEETIEGLKAELKKADEEVVRLSEEIEDYESSTKDTYEKVMKVIRARSSLDVYNLLEKELGRVLLGKG